MWNFLLRRQSGSRVEAGLAMRLESGDRVRVIQAEGPYTGCRGTVADASGPAEDGQLPLGYYVAIDGENGVVRPFLVEALERIAAVSSRPPPGSADQIES